MGAEREARLAIEREDRRRRAKAAEPEIIRKERSGEIQPDQGLRFRTSAANFHTVRCWRPSGLRELHGRFYKSDSSGDSEALDDRGKPRLGGEDFESEEWSYPENSASGPEENPKTRVDYEDYSASKRTVIVRLADGSRRITRNSGSIHGDANDSGNCDDYDSILKP